MNSKWYEATKKEMSGPLSYFRFEKIDTAYQVRDRYQIAYGYYNNNQNRTWSNASVRGTFDTLQLFDSKGNPKVRIPFTKGDTGKDLELFTMSYPEHSQGGAFQLFPVDKMDIKYDKLDILPNTRIDLIRGNIIKGWIEEYAILRKFIEKYCEEQDKNRLIEMLNMKDRFLFKYFVNEFSKLKIPNKMTEEDLKEYKEKIMIYI